jgi:hypothetical protein
VRVSVPLRTTYRPGPRIVVLYAEAGIGRAILMNDGLLKYEQQRSNRLDSGRIVGQPEVESARCQFWCQFVLEPVLARHLDRLTLKPLQTSRGAVYEVSGVMNVTPEGNDVMQMVPGDGVEPPTPAFSARSAADLV